MSELKINGKIIAIMDTQQVTDSFSKREFVIETNEQYPQMIKFELTQGNCSKLDFEKVGNELTVHFNCRGRKWTNKQGEDVYFVTLQAWRLESVSSEPQVSTGASEPPADSFADDLPF